MHDLELDPVPSMAFRQVITIARYGTLADVARLTRHFQSSNASPISDQRFVQGRQQEVNRLYAERMGRCRPPRAS